MSVEPFLLQRGVPRRSELDILGRYSSELDMWMVPSSNGEVPAIEVSSSRVLDHTKTMTRIEEDDERATFFMGTLQMQTKTMIGYEGEDQNIDGLIASIQTKTDAGREADDSPEMLV